MNAVEKLHKAEQLLKEIRYLLNDIPNQRAGSGPLKDTYAAASAIGKYLDEPAPDKPTVMVQISGGTLVASSATEPVSLLVLDFDEASAGGKTGFEYNLELDTRENMELEIKHTNEQGGKPIEL